MTDELQAYRYGAGEYSRETVQRMASVAAVRGRRQKVTVCGVTHVSDT